VKLKIKENNNLFLNYIFLLFFLVIHNNKMSGHAWVTLATNDSYAIGALVLAKSLRSSPVKTVHSLAILITEDVSTSMRETLSSIFDVVQLVDALDSKDNIHLSLIKRPELGITFTKLLCWKLCQFDKCVFLDADTLILQNCDELFDFDELSAAPDIGWPDCFNSGVFVFVPNDKTYEKLIDFATNHGSFDGGDQGLLNLYFSDWRTNSNKRLPFTYNTSTSVAYSYLPAFKQFEADIRIIHFLGPFKPWHTDYDLTTKKIVAIPNQHQHLLKYLLKWWELFCEFVHPQLKDDMTGAAGNFARVRCGQPKIPDIEAWHQGEIDYLGVDSFSNILSKIEETLGKNQPTSDVKVESKQDDLQEKATSSKVQLKKTPAPKQSKEKPSKAKK
jgi:glycogenin glucosyltransferase